MQEKGLEKSESQSIARTKTGELGNNNIGNHSTKRTKIEYTHKRRRKTSDATLRTQDDAHVHGQNMSGAPAVVPQAYVVVVAAAALVVAGTHAHDVLNNGGSGHVHYAAVGYVVENGAETGVDVEIGVTAVEGEWK